MFVLAGNSFTYRVFSRGLCSFGKPPRTAYYRVMVARTSSASDLQRDLLAEHRSSNVVVQALLTFHLSYVITN